MLNKIWSFFGLQSPTPPDVASAPEVASVAKVEALSNAVSPTGHFSILDGRCHGTVIDHGHPESLPLTVTLENNAEHSVLVRASATFASGSGGYEFAFDLPAGFDPSAVLGGSVIVLAENAQGLTGRLELERASEIALMNEQPNPAHEVLFELSFATGGTAEPCLGTGWGQLEEAVCCAEGPRATLDVAASISPDAHYELTIDCFAFLPAPHVENQRMTVTLNGFPHAIDVDSDYVGPTSLIYPRRSLSAAATVHIEFDLPDCFRPSDYALNDDVRQLSFAFRKLTFSRLLFSGSTSATGLPSK